jgi:di/tricarboxylate transporter
MTLSIAIVFIILAISVLLFVTELLDIDKIAFLIIVALVISGLTTPEEAISGFSSPATITILMLMIIAIGLEDNGVINLLTQSIKKLSLLPLILIVPVFMLVSASISAFISTTAVVVIFIKIISQLSEKYNFSSSKLLMPISFAGIFGGSCTLMGTSTNLLVNATASKLGVEKFTFFEFTLYGLVFLAIGIVFMTFASRFLPKSNQDTLRGFNENNDFLFTLTVPENSKFIGKPLFEIPFFENPDVTFLKMIRDNMVNTKPGKNTTLRVNDTVILMTTLEDFASIKSDDFVLAIDENDIELDNGKTKKKLYSYLEILILPGSEFIGKKLTQIKDAISNIGSPLGIQKKKMLSNSPKLSLPKAIKNLNTKAGDRILIKVDTEHLDKLYQKENIVVLRQHDDNLTYNKTKQALSIMILLGVVLLAALQVLTILSSTIIGVGAMLLTNCINLNNIYKRVNWQIIFLLAGMIPLGIAISNSKTDTYLATHLINLLNGQESYIALGVLFGITMILSGFISNNATAVIITPIAITLATGLSLPVKPFILAVLFGANFSFFTPMGYQTNTLIYGTGLYKFKHFLIIGGILSILVLVTGTFMLSMLFNT